MGLWNSLSDPELTLAALKAASAENPTVKSLAQPRRAGGDDSIPAGGPSAPTQATQLSSAPDVDGNDFPGRQGHDVARPTENIQLAASTRNPDYAARMLGYDRNTFGDMIHDLKHFFKLSPSDNLVFDDNGDVSFQGSVLGNIHDFAP